MTQLTHALGVHSMWGFTPAKNLVTDVSRKRGERDSTQPFNILLVKPCDPRHIIKTMSEAKLRPEGFTRPIHFYILEEHTEVLARHLLLFHIFLDVSIPIRHRAALFLEVFGNSLVQERTAEYIENAGIILTELIHKDGCSMSNLFDLSFLKFRERDNLETVFKSWKTSTTCDIEQERDQRLRHFYGERFDSRKNIIDWDYHTRVKEVASIIHEKQYREWRLSGVAYEFGEAKYLAPNRSCASFTEGLARSGKDIGMKKEYKGYWLDILIGPYISFGVDCNRSLDELTDHLFHVVNKGTGSAQHRHHCVEISMYNLISFMWKVQMAKNYKMKVKSDIFSGLGEIENGQIRDNASLKLESKNNTMHQQEISDERLTRNTSEAESNMSEKIIREGLKIIPLCGDMRKQLLKKQFKNMFDVVCISNQSSETTNDNSLNSILRAEGCLMMETGKFVFPLQSLLQQDLLVDKLVAMGNNLELNLIPSQKYLNTADLRNLDYLVYERKQ